MKKSEDAYKKVLTDAWKKRSIAFKKKWIAFLLNFSQMDLSKEERLIPYQKAMSFLSSPDPGIEFYLFDENSFDSWWKNQRGNYPTIDLEKIQLELKKVLKFWKRKDMTDLTSPVVLYTTKTIFGLYIDHEHFTIKHILYGVDTAPTTWLFIRMLNGLPLETIRECPDCHRYFLHLSKRKRDYCSPTCSSRSIQRERREELKKRHPQKHKQFLIEQRFRMGKLRMGSKKYEARLKKSDFKLWKVYKQWKKNR